MNREAAPLLHSIPKAAWKPAAVKDLFERPLAAVMLVLASPLLLGVALLVWTTSGRPILHRRRVIGRHGIVFDALKFRTMVINAGEILASDPALRAAFEVRWKLDRDPRVTPLGAFLRKYSLDELPQLVNVIRGEMSLIGPRMIAPGELVRYGRHATKLLSVKPGITGLWQVSGRQTTTYEQRVELDMRYIDHWSFATDLRILAKTIAVVLSAKGAG